MAEMIKMWDPTKNAVSLVNPKYVDMMKQKGLTLDIPDRSTLQGMYETVKSGGEQQYWTPSTGVTETKPVVKPPTPITDTKTPTLDTTVKAPDVPEMGASTGGMLTPAWQRYGFPSAQAYLDFTRQQDAGTTKEEADRLLEDYKAKSELPTLGGGDVLPPDIPQYQPRERQEFDDTQIADTREQMLELQKQQAVRAFQDAFASTQRGLEAERGQLDPMRRQAIGQVRTEDVMAQQAAEQRAAGMGLAGSGAMAQSDIARSVATGQRMSDISQQFTNLEADINRRLQDAQSQMAQGIATVETEMEMSKLQSQLDDLNAQKSAALKQAELQDERDWEMYLRELENYDQRQLDTFRNDLEQENMLLDAQIREAEAAGDQVRKIELENLKSANDIKLAGVRASTGGGLTQSNIATNARYKISNGIPLSAEEASVMGVSPGYVDPNFTGTGGVEAPSMSTITQSIDNAISGTRTGSESPAVAKQTAINWLIDNASLFGNDANLLRDVMLRYGITAQEIEEVESRRYNVNPSVGM